MSVNPYSAPDEASIQGDVRRQKLARRYVLVAMWAFGAILPAVGCAAAVIATDQSRYGDSDEVRNRFRMLLPTIDYIFWGSLALSLLVMCIAIVKTKHSVLNKLYLYLLSVVVLVVSLCAGIFGSMFLTGIPVD